MDSLKNMRKMFNGLCKPSQLYLAFSIFSLFFVVVQNVINPNSNQFCLGKHSCDLGFSKWFTFIPQIVYIAVWTIILNSLCKTGYERLSWLMVLFPVVLMFTVIALLMLSSL